MSSSSLDRSSTSVQQVYPAASVRVPLTMRVSVSPSVNSVHSNNSAASDASSCNSSSGSNPTSPGLPVEHEDIINLTNFVKTFRECLGKLKKIFHPEMEKSETPRVQAHERLGDVLRTLRTILEHYPAIQSTQLLMAAGNMIQRVKEYPYEEEASNVTDFFEAIDQLALAFSTRVSEYLMGDIESSSTSSKTRLSSRENLVNSPEDTPLTAKECDDRFHRLPEGIDLALHRAKVWSKYAKDVMGYIEKRAQLEADHARNLAKLAHATKPLLREEGFLPFQAIYCTALDQDIENSNAALATSSLLLGHKFLEPLTCRRLEHDRIRKAIKTNWSRELKRMQETVNALRKAKSSYMQRQTEYERLKSQGKSGVEGAQGNPEAGGPGELPNGKQQDKRRRLEDEAGIRAMEAENVYRTCVHEANERAFKLDKLKKDFLVQTRELIYQCDQTMKAASVSYFQLQHTISAPGPVQFQTLCESSRLYEPGSQYVEFVKRLPISHPGDRMTAFPIYAFQAFGDKSLRDPCDEPAGSRMKSVSDSESVESGEDGPGSERRPSPRGNRSLSSGDELDLLEPGDSGCGPSLGSPGSRAGGGPSSPVSRAAMTHKLKKLKTPTRCKECDSYVYFHGIECSECGIAVHKKCLETLRIKCGHKRLMRKMTTFGVPLSLQRVDSVPYIVVKCISEIDCKGYGIKGLYRVSGVKSQVERLCQSFENGAELVDLSDVQPNVIANVLKLYFRQLPEPLLTFRLYPEFIRVAKQFPASSKEHSPALDTGSPSGDKSVSQFQEIAQLVNVVNKLPRAHYLTLSYLVHHLKRVADNHPENNMPSSNLGIVFGPTLLRTSEGGSSLSSLVDTVHQTRVVDLLISFASDVFGCPPKVDHKGHLGALGTPEMSRPVIRSSSQAIIRSGKMIMDFTEQARKGSDPSKSESGVQRAYSSSAIITIAGHKVIASSPSGNNNNSVSNNLDPNKPTINDLRRQFFTEVTGPPDISLSLAFDPKVAMASADSSDSDLSTEPSPTSSTTLTQSGSFNASAKHALAN
ncbi:Rho GTPase-activating protein 45 [Halotydeus destructor]|nr:Rho GTPase-activating protein 45 [Halotydeus destructor]